MSGPGPLGSRLTCPCQLCLTWRRLGEEVHLGHESVSFQAKALGLLRAAFEELVDYREAHRLSLWQPLAGGSQQGAEDKHNQDLAPVRGSSRGGDRERRERRKRSREGESEEARPAKKTDKERRREESRSRRRRRHKSPQSPVVSTGARPVDHQVSPQSHQRTVRSSSEKGATSVKEERSKATSVVEGVAAPEGRDSKEGRHPRPATPSRSSRLRLIEQRKELLEDARPGPEEPPPGCWSLHARPAEPRHPPRGFRPPEPQGPPPGWVPPGGSKSKGVVRRERQEDILQFGLDPARKAEREAKRRGWSHRLPVKRP